MKVLSGLTERLRLLRRDVRVTAKVLRVAGRGVGSNGTGSLVQAILARYGFRSQHWPRLWLALWRAMPSTGPQSAFYRLRLMVTPNLALTVLGRRTPHGLDAFSSRVDRQAQPAVRRQVWRPTSTEAPVSQHAHSAPVWGLAWRAANLVQPKMQAARRPTPVPRIAQHARLHEPRERTLVEWLERWLVTRGSRIELPARSPVSASTGQIQADRGSALASASPARHQQPVPKILRRSGWSVDETRASHQEYQEGWQDPMRLFPAREMGGQPAETPVVDVGYLTRQVMQAIDRHVVANRERMGRI
jgi:hypothetical protein